jgi:sulfite exporter TauE/SafE
MKTQDIIIIVLAALAVWMAMGNRLSFADEAAKTESFEKKLQRFLSNFMKTIKEKMSGKKSTYAAGPCPGGCGM